MANFILATLATGFGAWLLCLILTALSDIYLAIYRKVKWMTRTETIKFNIIPSNISNQ